MCWRPLALAAYRRNSSSPRISSGLWVNDIAEQPTPAERHLKKGSLARESQDKRRTILSPKVLSAESWVQAEHIYVFMIKAIAVSSE